MSPSTPPSARRPPQRPAPWRTTGLLSLLALGIASPLAVLGLLGASAAVGQTARLGLPPGVHDDGVAVAAAAPAAAGPATGAAATPALALRRGCHWGQPGRQPYRGTVRQALQAAGLPEDVIAQIEAQHRAGQKSGRLAISRSGIRHTGDGRVFPARGIALTHGMTLCQDASVNFAKGHVEMADLYEARDAQGKPHAVMVPDVCGNVSVLGAAGSRPGRGAVAGVAATLQRRAQALADLADALDAPAAGAAGHAGDIGGAAGTGGTGGAGGAGQGPGAGRALAGTRAAGGAGGDAADAAGRPGPSPWPLLLAGAAGSGGGAGSAGSAPMAALALVSDLLVPPSAAASVARGISRVTATAGRTLEAVVPTPTGGGAGGTAGADGNAQPVPEPGSLSISLLALALLGWRMAKRRRG